MEHSRMADTPAGPSDGYATPDRSFGAAAMQSTPDATGIAEQQAMHAINQRIFETSLDLILVVDRRGTIIRVSPSSIFILGYHPDEMVGHSAAEFLYAQDLDSTRNEMRAARRGRETRNFDCRYVHKEGRVVTLGWTGVWSEPEQQHFFIGRDITALKAAEQALRISEERFRLVVESAPNAIVMVSAGGAIEMVNAQAERIFGYSRTELLGQPVEILLPERYRLHHPKLRALFFADPRRIRRMGAGSVLYGRRRDGREFPAEIGLNPIETEDGMMVLSAIVDITERKQTEQRLRERGDALVRANRQLNAVLKASPVAILMLDRDGRVVLWNEAAERIFGYTEEEALGRPPPYLVEEHIGEFEANVARAADDDSATGFLETQRRRKDGALIDVSVRWARVNDEAGQMLGIMYAVADITERKKLEGHLQQAQKMEAIGTLTGGMAHDFNNLLGVIILNLDVLREKLAGDPQPGTPGADDPQPADPEIDELTREAMIAAMRGAELIRRLLAFARQQPLQPQRTDVNKLVTEITKLLDRTLGEEVRITLDLDDGVWPTAVDPAQLETTLANLATNARDAMPDGGELTIATGNRQLDEDYASQYAEVTPGDYAMIEVSDSGDGMIPEVLGQAFEPFFTTKGPGKGSGLGLSMVYGFIKQSGGHINIYSEAGVGTTVRLFLPRATVGTAAAETVAPWAFDRGGGQTVLAVEDNPSMRRIVVRQLTELGYRALEAEDARAALHIMERQPVAVLFSDVVLPGGMSGYELARIASSRWPAIKIVLTSGFPENRIAGDGKLFNIKMLSKPYRKEDIARIIANAFAKNAAQ
jgi:PAS domain S-box-containing protein